MADVSDVANVLAATIAQDVYPSGTGQASVFSRDVFVFTGWPQQNEVEKRLADGKVIVSVYPRPEERNTTRDLTGWRTLNIPAPSLSITVSGSTATVSGSIVTPQNAILLVGKKGYAYPLQSSDTLSTIAAALASMVNADVPASSSGPVISVPGRRDLVGRVGVFGTSIREVKAQERYFQITIWASTPAIRDQVGSFIDRKLGARSSLNLLDGSYGKLEYRSSPITDVLAKAQNYQRQLIYSVDFPTTELRTDPTIGIVNMRLLDPGDGVLLNADV